MCMKKLIKLELLKMLLLSSSGQNAPIHNIHSYILFSLEGLTLFLTLTFIKIFFKLMKSKLLN